MQATQINDDNKTFNAADYVVYENNSVVSKTLIKKDTGTLTFFAFDAGEGLSEHTAPFDAIVQIMDGCAVITIDSINHIVKAGEMVVMPANIPHALFAAERFKMMLTMIKN